MAIRYSANGNMIIKNTKPMYDILLYMGHLEFGVVILIFAVKAQGWAGLKKYCMFFTGSQKISQPTSIQRMEQAPNGTDNFLLQDNQMKFLDVKWG